ncbi:MAG TPA: resolvase [Burkholderiaceae bacterium]|nr:resolvase [Burkholderiaceae bacterium]
MGTNDVALLAPRILHRRTDPDLIDRIFEFIVAQVPEVADRHVEIKRRIRQEFASQRAYIRAQPGTNGSSWRGEHPLVVDVARLFDGRNATSVARELGISRATVYRLLKQPGHK